ncbi:MAG: hemolysin family protein [Bacteroidetes bacterium]|nr:hemolysin family protein [Bacteroidota bacterium]MBU1114538.1 hemolysin family protein [Bacteroidota bacterium]MBU1798719.1 hemolysin family protein [Bacteroidota bacterium]
MGIEIFGLILLLVLSGFFSASEIAFVVSNKLKIELRARKNDYSAKIISFFSERQQIYFSTILISNNIVNVAFSSLVTLFLLSAFGLGEVSILVISTLLLLIFGELIPKYFAREYPDKFVLFSAIPIRFVSVVLTPLVWVTSTISHFIVSSSNIKEEKISHLFDKEDIQYLLNESISSSTKNTINVEEFDLINKVIELGEQKIYEVMTPRTDIVGIEIDSDISEAIKLFKDSGYSKILVYEENMDNIKGFIHALDMFKFPKTISEIKRDILFVPETKKSLDLLNELLDKRISIALVVDEFGGTEGIVTTEDIIEEMLGEIRDEYDEDEEIFKKIDDNLFIISGKYEIDRLNDEYDFQIPEGEYETIAGYIITELGMIPSKKKIYQIGNFSIEIIHSSKQRIELVKLKILDT